MVPELIVGLGGFLGAIARYKVSSALLHWYGAEGFPLGTFVVNILGCLLIGVSVGLSARVTFFDQQARLLFVTGFLGSFTTFSAFGLETFYLIKRSEMMLAGSNVVLSITCGLFALWCGSRL
jgi:CrcB protein